MMSFLTRKNILMFFGVISFCFMLLLPGLVLAADMPAETGAVGKVICNVVKFAQQLGLPVMTVVILGASVMAIFGRLAWPAIVMLVAFTGVFFGAPKVVSMFAKGINIGSTAVSGTASATAMTDVCN